MKYILKIFLLILIPIGLLAPSKIWSQGVVLEEDASLQEEDINSQEEVPIQEELTNTEEEPITYEEISAQEKEEVSPVAPPAEQKAPLPQTLNPQGSIVVKAVDFNAVEGAGVVTLKLSGVAKYKEISKEPEKFGIKIENASIPLELEVARDVSDFASPVKMVSSFNTPGEEAVVIRVQLKSEVPGEVIQEDNKIVLRFKEPEKAAEEVAEEELEAPEEIYASTQEESLTQGGATAQGEGVNPPEEIPMQKEEKEATSLQPPPLGPVVVEVVDFDAVEGAGVVTLKLSGVAEYKEIPKEPEKFGIKIENASIPFELEVARDVSDFASPVKMVSSFNAPGEEAVIILVQLKSEVPGEVMQEDNKVVLQFKEPEKAAEEVAEEELEAPEELYAFDFRIATIPGAKKIYRGERVSLDFKDADVRDVLRILSDISGLNVIVAREVRGTVTIRLINIPWDQALDVVLEDAGLAATVEGNVMKIAPLRALRARQVEIQRAATSREQVEPLINKQIFINYADAAEIVPLTRPLLSGRGDIRIDSRTNSLLVRDTTPRVRAIEELAVQLDTRTPQIVIESRIVQATLDFVRDLGVQWGFTYRASAATGNPTGLTFPSSIQTGGPGTTPPFGTIEDAFVVDLPAGSTAGSLGIILGSITGAFDLDIRLTAAEQAREARVLSSPRVLTLDNQPARIEQGASIPFLSVSAAGTQTQFVDATLRLEVTPHVTNDNRVLMDVSITNNAPSATIVGAGGQPAIDRQEAQTQILASDGETIVIGGIFTRTTSESLFGVPWFYKLPLLGFLFRNENITDQRRELIVFITPRIVR